MVDRVAVIRIDRPPVNAIDRQTQVDLVAVADEVRRRDDIRAAIIWGGDRHFAAGGDLTNLASRLGRSATDDDGAMQDRVGILATIGKPTVAAISGFALGGGLEIALSCDVRLAADNARLGTPEIRLGLIPGAGGTQRLARLIGASRAKDMLFSGRHVDAQEALAIGLVDAVVAPESLMQSALDRAALYASQSVHALRAAKTAVDRGLTLSFKEGMALERELFGPLLATDECVTAVKQFLDRQGTP